MDKAFIQRRRRDLVVAAFLAAIAAAVPLFDGAEVRADFGVLGEVCLSVDE